MHPQNVNDTETVTRRCSIKNVFLKISQSSQKTPESLYSINLEESGLIIISTLKHHGLRVKFDRGDPGNDQKGYLKY